MACQPTPSTPDKIRNRHGVPPIPAQGRRAKVLEESRRGKAPKD